MLGHWHLRGFGIWAVEEKVSCSFIGRIGLQRLIWFDEVELVWMLTRTAWGKGYASEGAAAVIEFGLKTLKFPRLAAVIHPENQPSIKLANRLGMNLSGEVEREGITFYKFCIEPSI
jgi:RimJ/RimL family protein N-acetyltransferase